MKLGPLTIIWKNVLLFLVLHVIAFYGVYLTFFQSNHKWKTFSFVIFWSQMSSLGVTAGAHRLWTHKTYEAKLPLRIFLAIANAANWQKSVYDWVRDHRAHHKFCETNADPSNMKRGFFFAHIGWLMVKKQQDLHDKTKTVDFSDVLADPVIRIQRRFYYPIAIIFGLIIPTFIPYYYWNEHWIICTSMTVSRIVSILHLTSLVNSVSHLWGMKPYEKNISATEGKLVAICAMGEGFHNYHHTFPSDYGTSELGYKYNFTTFFIDCMAYIGQAYNLKTTSPEIVHQRKLNAGDGSYFDEKEWNEWAHHNKSD